MERQVLFYRRDLSLSYIASSHYFMYRPLKASFKVAGLRGLYIDNALRRIRLGY